MKIFNKFLSVVCAAPLLISAAVQPASAQSSPTLCFTVSSLPSLKVVLPEKIDSDKEFSAKAVLEAESGVRAGDFVVKYDETVLECVGVSSEAIGSAWITADKKYSDGQIRFSLMSNVDLTADTALVTMQFKSKENADSKSILSISGTGVYDGAFNEVTLQYVGAAVNVVRPEYIVNFYDLDGETLISTQKVMSGDSAIAPDIIEAKENDNASHLKFSGWNKDYSEITDNTDLVAVYKEEAHTEITQSFMEATCTESGLTEGKFCIVCGTVFVAQEVIPPNGHTSVDTPAVEPGFDTYGSTGGTHCGVCGIVLTEPDLVEPTGPIVSAILNNDYVLTVVGGISDTPIASGITFLAVYDRFDKMLYIKNITDTDQSDFSIPIENMKDAYTVKILRWAMPDLRPLYNAVEISVEK